ncbi:hypothetical protein NEF87_004129 [Candidatus Lokiarchaeum ossiferum]|uniref:PUA domain-containing protein n=1 Tax=Candidatus Lokiarchaeum ossiferum TaxID=2951803 RepID=A0ABY6HWE2_9ARCH|nr:hypothetical protein NEF87_004129 [Candidatus Lokiarchaeum sp. B-35]
MAPAPLKIHQRHLLKSKDKKKLIAKFDALLAENAATASDILSSKSKVEWIRLDQNQELYAIDGVLTFWLKEDKLVPLLSYLMKNELPFKSVHVDEGAIKFVSKGADVMRPGITTIDPGIKEGEIILIKDPSHNRVLAVGEATFDAAEMEAREKGKVIKCVHSLTDGIWAFSKTFK